MAKILSKSGDSLADVYNVLGSVAGIDELQSKDVNLVHEMGATLFSERFSSEMVLIDTGGAAQNVTFDVVTTFPETTRILGVQLVATDATRVAQISCGIVSGTAVGNQEIPIASWDAALSFGPIRLILAGSIQNRDLLFLANPAQVPNLLIGSSSPRPARAIAIRGVTTGFGAGTVNVSAILFLAFAQSEALSSRGLPIPGW